MAVDRATQLVHHELELGSWTRAIRLADERLRPLMHRPLLGFEQRQASFASWLEPPRPSITLMVDFDGGLRANGVPLPDAWIGGLNDAYTLVGFGERYGSADLQLTPLGAFTVLGRPLSELAGRICSLEELFGSQGSDLTERLRELPDWDRRFDAIEAFLLDRVAKGPRPTPAVAWAWDRLVSTGGRARIQALASELGCSRRYLLRTFREQIGLPPKTVARLLRFQHVCRRLERGPTSWIEIAYESGYSDQSHLNRDFRELAGTTPSDFLIRQLPGGGLVGDGCSLAA